MSKHSYFTFRLGDRQYGINILHVEETFPLPELVLIPDASHHLIGVVDLRGEMLPILDLTSSAASQPSNYHLTDSVVILKQAQIRIGLVVNQVHGVTDISDEAVAATFSKDQQLLNVEQSAISGITLDEEILILRAPEDWIDFLGIQQAIVRANWLGNNTDNGYHTYELKSDDAQSASRDALDFYPDATPQERAILRERSNRLKQSTESKYAEELNPVVVIILSDQPFGFDLKIIKEFIDVNQVVPIPCSPSHFIGNVNLRGEILTLIDIRGSLNLPLKKFTIPSKVMVIEVEDIVAGIVIDEIRDSLFLLNLHAMTKAAKVSSLIPNQYLQGSIPYQERSMYVLDLVTLFSKGLST